MVFFARCGERVEADSSAKQKNDAKRVAYLLRDGLIFLGRERWVNSDTHLGADGQYEAPAPRSLPYAYSCIAGRE